MDYDLGIFPAFEVSWSFLQCLHSRIQEDMKIKRIDKAALSTQKIPKQADQDQVHSCGK